MPKNGDFPSRFWVEAVLALVAGVMTGLTLVWHDWLKAVGVDYGAGPGEWVIVGVLQFVTIVLVGGAPVRRAEARLG